MAAGPNDIWAADYKGQFRLKNAQYCFPLTVSDLASRYLLGVDAHPAVSYELTQRHFQCLFEAYGLPNRIRTDNGVPFASNALARLSQLSAWFIKLGIYPKLIEPGKPQQNAIHERMHRTLKQEATIPPAASLPGQQRKLEGVPAGLQRGASARRVGDEAAGRGVSAVVAGDAEADRAL